MTVARGHQAGHMIFTCSIRSPDKLPPVPGLQAAHIGVKAGLYGALTRLHQADVFIADDECGEQIACLQV